MRFSPSVEEILKRLENVSLREVADGNYEFYDTTTGAVIETVSKEEVEKASRRLGFKKAQKKRKGVASW